MEDIISMLTVQNTLAFSLVNILPVTFVGAKIVNNKASMELNLGKAVQ